ncbi:unnamed protein product [Timema podura]|uniref:Uncharacterized protein n=1 Tax=Timema podura TaxID=61482 RepID=A0ABN7NNU7_TIMPD|nr:unnamed protein product [Timema podura]
MRGSDNAVSDIWFAHSCTVLMAGHNSCTWPSHPRRGSKRVLDVPVGTRTSSTLLRLHHYDMYPSLCDKASTVVRIPRSVGPPFHLTINPPLHISAVDEQVFNTFQIITYSLIGVCLFVIVVLCALVAYLFIRLHRLERVAKPQKHAFHNEGIQPEEELAKRGFSIYKGPGKVWETLPPDIRQQEEMAPLVSAGRWTLTSGS